MKHFLEFSDEATAHRRNRELMDAGRKPGNPDGDGKPYTTTERHSLRVADDGTAVLEVDDVSGLTENEKRALLADRPEKFNPPPERDLL